MYDAYWTRHGDRHEQSHRYAFTEVQSADVSSLPALDALTQQLHEEASLLVSSLLRHAWKALSSLEHD
jgi:hypothetical protein